MKSPMRLMLLSLSVCGLAACASMDEQAAYADPTPSLMDEDEAYMAYIERVARRRGIEVVWVNVPTRRPAGESPDNSGN